MLNDLELDKVTSALEKFVLNYNWLARHHVAKGVVLQHIVDLARWMNPVVLWRYKFKRYIGHGARATHACAAGTHMTGISKTSVASNAALASHLALVTCCRPRKHAPIAD